VEEKESLSFEVTVLELWGVFRRETCVIRF